MTNLTTIDFHGAKLIAVPGDKPETTLVAMKPIVEGMGLDWGGQHKKMLAHPVLCKGISVTEILSDGGAQATVCLTLDLLNFWLATIHPDRIKDQAVRARVVEYQTECARVLFNHFFGKAIASGSHLTAREVGDISKGVVNKALAPIHAQIVELMEEVRSLVVTRPTGVAVCAGMTAKEWLIEYKCEQKGRNSVVRQVSANLRDLPLRQDIVLPNIYGSIKPILSPIFILFLYMLRNFLQTRILIRISMPL
ncbi:hypothetical protein JK191_13545 [Gluconobacter sphaericus]|uniref:phage antirepressor N-terminal domain-containing protein n=1 Tax=Gluconobacter sphaericus TaxID=574987 RepID=UPI001B8D7475|nr:phage antirepressor N-terminal domain-containing protein [Gluconobacter sphaericus]MBS1098545.1 hypothetical protein [Gluconobacter sphaericus]